MSLLVAYVSIGFRIYDHRMHAYPAVCDILKH